MRGSRYPSAEALAQVVRESLKNGKSVEIEGLGVFRLKQGHGFEFTPDPSPRVFIAYVDEEFESANRLFDGLARAGMSPWLDKRRLLPGQNWPRAIERAIGISDFFIPCFSRRACTKRGQFQAELRYALECASRIPLEEIFIIPVRLDECEVPQEIRERLHYVDLFPDWERGEKRIIRAIWKQVRCRFQRLPLAS